jgi:hypothetical protein
MNKLDEKLESLVSEYGQLLNLKEIHTKQMIREIGICASAGYNSRAELIRIVKSAMAGL